MARWELLTPETASKIWDQTLLSFDDYTTFQSYAWGEYRRALASYEEAAEMTEGETSARIHGRALTGLGMTHLGLGEPARARADFEAVLATPFGDEQDPTSQCGVRHGLARALIETEGDSPRVRELATKTLEACKAFQIDDAATLADLEAWGRGETRGPK